MRPWDPSAPPFQIPSGGEVCSAGSLTTSTWMVCPRTKRGLPSSLILLVYQREAGFLQGITLRSLLPPWLTFTLSSNHVFRCTGQEIASCEGFRRSSFAPTPGCSFSKAVQSPLSFQFHWPPGYCFGGGIPSPRQGALSASVLPCFESQGFSCASPFPGSPRGGRFPRGAVSRIASPTLLSKQQTFEEPRFPRGILHSPHITIGNVVTQFRPASRLSVPCGTHNYTRFEKCVNTFLQNF